MPGRSRTPVNHDEHWRFALEWLRVDSDVPARAVDLAEPAFATESKIELSVRYSLDPYRPLGPNFAASVECGSSRTRRAIFAEP